MLLQTSDGHDRFERQRRRKAWQFRVIYVEIRWNLQTLLVRYIWSVPPLPWERQRCRDVDRFGDLAAEFEQVSQFSPRIRGIKVDIFN